MSEYNELDERIQENSESSIPCTIKENYITKKDLKENEHKEQFCGSA